MALSNTYTSYTTNAAVDNTEIKYDPITRDYAVLVDGVAVTYGRSYHEAEQKRTAYLAERAEESSACGGFGCVDTCGDCVAPPANWPRDFATGKPMDWYAAKAAAESGFVIIETAAALLMEQQ